MEGDGGMEEEMKRRRGWRVRGSEKKEGMEGMEGMV